MKPLCLVPLVLFAFSAALASNPPNPSHSSLFGKGVQEIQREKEAFTKPAAQGFAPSHTGFVSGAKRPVLFVHGLLLDAEGSWTGISNAMEARGGIATFKPNWHFRVNGAWKDIRNMSTDELGQARFADVVDYYIEQADQIKARFGHYPVVIGHSLGALIAEQVSANGRAEALVQIAPAPHTGVATIKPSAYGLAVDATEAKAFGNGAKVYKPEEFVKSFIGHEAGTTTNGIELFKAHGLPLPARVLLDAIAFTGPVRHDDTPLFVFTGTRDTVTPHEIGRAMAKQGAARRKDRVDYVDMDGVSVGTGRGRSASEHRGTNHGTILLDLGPAKTIPNWIVDWMGEIGGSAFPR